jgi:hypothetical protein
LNFFEHKVLKNIRSLEIPFIINPLKSIAGVVFIQDLRLKSIY